MFSSIATTRTTACFSMFLFVTRELFETGPEQDEAVPELGGIISRYLELYIEELDGVIKDGCPRALQLGKVLREKATSLNEIMDNYLKNAETHTYIMLTDPFCTLVEELKELLDNAYASKGGSLL